MKAHQTICMVLASATLTATPLIACAADLAYKAPPLVPAYNWTGFYGGANVGGAWGTSNAAMTTCIGCGYLVPADAVLFNNNGTASLRPGGFTGGGQIGYNWQAGSIVWGLESDFDYLGLKSSSSITVPYIPAFAPNTFTLNQSILTSWLATVRPRVGWTTNNWLFYGTGGLAVTNISYNGSFSDTFGAAETGSISRTRVGWTVGGGAEWEFASRWSAKVEYLYANFGSLTTTGVNNAFFGAAQVVTHNVNLQTNIVRFGLNYKFWF